MSDVEIYTIAKVAREKLLTEYYVKDHNLHKLVAHANLYENLLDAYYKQDVPIVEKDGKRSETSYTRRVTVKVPAERLPVRGRDGRDLGFKDERPTFSPMRKVEIQCFETRIVCDDDRSGLAEGKPEVTIVEMTLEDDD